jgi:5-hydroxyisourate hydrolase
VTRIAATVIDCTYGHAAEAIDIRIDRAEGSHWINAANAHTGSNRRVEDWNCGPFSQGLYRIVLDSDSYFAGLGLIGAFPEIQAIFRVRREFGRCHIQVALSPYAYSTHFEAVATYDDPGRVTPPDRLPA